MSSLLFSSILSLHNHGALSTTYSATAEECSTHAVTSADILCLVSIYDRRNLPRRFLKTTSNPIYNEIHC
jgi:hypothetical protein